MYALQSNTGQFLSTGQTLVTNGTGGTSWLDMVSSLIITGGTVMNNLPCSISTIYVNTCNIQILSNDLYTGLSSLSVAISQTAGTISQSNLVSSMQGIGTLGFTSTATVSTMIGVALNSNLTSTVAGLGTSKYVSSTQLISTSLGISQLISSSVIQTTTGLTSTVAGLGQLGYISTAQLVSTSLGFSQLISSLWTSSVAETTTGLTSTVEGLGTSKYVSSTQLISTSLGFSQSISSLWTSSATGLTSTVVGLGTSQYVSSTQLISTVKGLGEIYISSALFTSTVGGLGSIGYVSSAQLVSTVEGLGSIGYLSSTQLMSTVGGLGSIGYVSSTQLMSTFDSLSWQKANIRFDTTTSVTTIDSINYFATAPNLIYVSTFFQSSFFYSGNNQQLTAATCNIHDLCFSTANLNFSHFSSFIDANSRLTLDIYPTIVLSKLATGATALPILFISSFLQAGNTRFFNTTTISPVFIANTRTLLESGLYVDSSNIFNQCIKMTIPMNTVNNCYSSTFSLIHYMPSSLNNGGFQNALHNAQITPIFASTNSLFLSVQNIA